MSQEEETTVSASQQSYSLSRGSFLILERTQVKLADGKSRQEKPSTNHEESKTQCGAISSSKMSEETLQNQGATCQWIFARTPEPS